MPAATLVSHEPAVLNAETGNNTYYQQPSPKQQTKQTSSFDAVVDTQSPFTLPTQPFSADDKRQLYNRAGSNSNYADLPQSLPTPPLHGNEEYNYHEKSSANFLSAVFERQGSQPELSTRHIDASSSGNALQNLWNYLFPSSTHFTVSDNLKFILNCCMWYLSSSLTNNTGKQILNVFKFPVTLTFVQFGLVAMWCYLVAAIFHVTTIRTPTQKIISTMTPLAAFLIVGHVFSSIAISRVPVSLVHTIKALAPLFTVLFYRFIFQVQYTSKVYLSLLPLTLGVILACTFTFSNNLIGLTCAFLSCLVFVTQNIFSKKLIFKEANMGKSDPNKLDKMNMLFYSSILSFVLMSPLWLYSDGAALVTNGETSVSKTRLIMYFLLNGTTNFGQNWFAFTTLSMTSPVTYSIASLVKRIFVIVMSIIWFGQQVSFAQSMGIMLTFVGLWMYQSAKRDVERGETKIREKGMDVLPTSAEKASPSFDSNHHAGTAAGTWLSWMSNHWSKTLSSRESKIL